MQEKEIENKKNYLNLILDDFYICKERLKVYKDVCPTIISERYGLKVVVIYEQKVLHGKNGGRNPEHPTSRKKGELRVQRLELILSGICSTLTTVQKDNLVLIKEEVYVRR